VVSWILTRKISTVAEDNEMLILISEPRNYGGGYFTIGLRGRFRSLFWGFHVSLKVWDFFLENSRTWKVLEKYFWKLHSHNFTGSKFFSTCFARRLLVVPYFEICGASTLYLNIRGLQKGPWQVFKGFWKSPGFLLSVIITLLQIVSRVRQWKSFENWSITGEDIDRSKLPRFLWPTVYVLVLFVFCIIYFSPKRFLSLYRLVLGWRE